DRLRKRKLARSDDPVFLDGGNAIDERGQKLRSLGQVELNQLPLGKGRHHLGFSELVDQRRIGRHRNTHESGPERHPLYMDGLLTVKGERERERLAGGQLPILVREPEGPTEILVDRNQEENAALIGSGGRAMRESSAFVVGVGTAMPVTDINGA